MIRNARAVDEAPRRSTHPRPDSEQRWGVDLILRYKADELRALAHKTSLQKAAELMGHDKRTVGRAAQILGLTFLSFPRQRIRPMGRY